MAKKLNILFSDSCRSNSWGGGEKWTVMTAAALNKRGHNCHLICRTASQFTQRTSGSGLTIHQAAFRNSLDIATVLQIVTIIRKYKIDIIVCITNRDVKLAGLAGKITGIPVISRQGLALIMDKPKYQLLIKQFTTSIITNTQTIKQLYESYSWFPANHIEVIYNGVLPFPPPTQVKEIRQQYLSSPEEKLILSAGRLNTQKGFTYLIEAAKIASNKGKAWKFLIMGEGNERKNLEQLIKQYDLKNIYMPGACTNMQDYYASADLFVLPSIKEGTPNVVLEAMISNCPVIATDVNGASEVIENNINGWLIPAQNGEAIFNAIENCIDQPEKLAQIKERAYQTVHSQFTIEKSVNKFIEYVSNTISKYEKNHHKNA